VCQNVCVCAGIMRQWLLSMMLPLMLDDMPLAGPGYGTCEWCIFLCLCAMGHTWSQKTRSDMSERIEHANVEAATAPQCNREGMRVYGGLFVGLMVHNDLSPICIINFLYTSPL